MNLWYKVKAAFGWRRSHQDGGRLYEYNAVTGARRSRIITGDGWAYTVIDQKWLDGGPPRQYKPVTDDARQEALNTLMREMADAPHPKVHSND